jgi:hypothetical protein
MAPFEALYGRRCRTPLSWSETGERKIFGPDLVIKAEDKVKLIQTNLKATQSRQKSYADQRKKPLQFQVGDYVYLRVSPTKGVQHFGLNRDGNGSGSGRVEQIPARERTRGHSSYPPTSVPAGKISYPCPNPSGFGYLSGFQKPRYTVKYNMKIMLIQPFQQPY